jgi:uncharacterized protein YjiS (DUF1127 family)
MSGSMAALSGGFPIRAPARQALGTRFRAIVALLAAEWRIRRDLAQLQALDARGLRDIGLTRGSLEGAVRHGGRGMAAPEPIPSFRQEQPIPSSWTEWR